MIKTLLTIAAVATLYAPQANAFGYPNWAYDWKKTGEALPRYDALTSKHVVQTKCPRAGFTVEACAVRMKTKCIVYHWRDMSARIDAHEQKHCDGYSHSRMDKLNSNINYNNNN